MLYTNPIRTQSISLPEGWNNLSYEFFINDSIGFVSGMYSLIMKSKGSIEGLPENYPWHLAIIGHSDNAEYDEALVSVYPFFL